MQVYLPHSSKLILNNRERMILLKINDSPDVLGIVQLLLK
jgi:hypothetical protein